MKTNDERYDEECAQYARAQLEAFITERFGEKGKQTKAGPFFGVSQGTISRILNGHSQPSLKILLLLARYTGRTIDDVLGLTRGTVSIESRIRDSQLQRVAEAVAEKVAARLKSDPPDGGGPANDPMPTIPPLPPPPALPPPAGRKPRRR